MLRFPKFFRTLFKLKKTIIMKSNLNENGRKPESSNPSTISTAFIQSLVDNYRNNQLAIINDNFGFPDAHSVWFNLPILKKFISDIEEEAQKIDPAVTDEDLGIRFYYAAYPEEPREGVPEDYAKRHTLIMIPTKKQEDLNYDFNPYTEEHEKAMAITVGRASMALAQNHGCLTPPDTSIVETY